MGVGSLRAVVSARDEVSPSPPPSYGSASSHLEAAYLLNTQRLHRVRLALTVLTLACAATVTGCVAHTISSYNKTHLSDLWWLPLWPQHFDLRPAKGILAGGGIITFMSLIFLAVAALPSPRARNTFLNAFATVTSVLGLIAAVFGVAYAGRLDAIDNGLHNHRDTIQSWTCRWSKGVSAVEIAAQAGTVAFGSISPPSGFGRLCKESHAAFDLLAILIAFEAALVALAGVGWFLERKVRMARREGDKEEMF